MEIKFRKEDRDYSCVAELHRVGGFSYDDGDVLCEYYDDAFEPQSVFVAELNDEVIGKIEIFRAFKRSRGFYAVVRRLVVKPEHRSFPVVRRLVEFAADEARRQGCCEIEGTVDPGNKRLMNLYERLGLKPMRHEIVYYKKL